MSTLNHYLNKFQFNTTVWRIKVSQDGNFLVAELRDGEKRKISLVCINLNDLKIIWEKHIVNWWTGILEVSDLYLFLHNYKDPKMPNTKGILVYDILTGNQVWENADFNFLTLNNQEILVSEESNSELSFKLVAQDSGIVKKECSLEDAENMISGGSLYNPLIINPQLYQEGEEYFNDVKEFLIGYNIYPKKNIEYFESGNKIIISTYYDEGLFIGQYILVFDTEGSLVFNQKIGSELERVGFGTFFVIKEQLLFVQDKKEIVILKLNF